MRCDTCDQSERVPVRRAKLAERDGRIAVVLDVPMEECPACGTRWLDMETAKRLDGAETATAHWESLSAAA